jgi:hypothetical protein
MQDGLKFFLVLVVDSWLLLLHFVYLNMELKVDIAFDELMHVIRQLPDDKKSQIKAELSLPKTKTEEKSNDDFLDFLLNGPVMNDEQYKNYLEARNHFNKWRAE